MSTTAVETPWELSSDTASVTARTPAGPVAEARVSESGERVVVEFWAVPAALPRGLATDLVVRAFALPAVRPRRPVSSASPAATASCCCRRANSCSVPRCAPPGPRA